MIDRTNQRHEAARRIIQRAYRLAAIHRDIRRDLIDAAGMLNANEAGCGAFIVDQLREAAHTTFALAGVVGEMAVRTEMHHMENAR